MEPGRFLALAAQVAAGFVADPPLRRAPRKGGQLFDLREPGKDRAEEARPIRRNITSRAVFLYNVTCRTGGAMVWPTLNCGAAAGSTTRTIPA